MSEEEKNELMESLKNKLTIDEYNKIQTIFNEMKKQEFDLKRSKELENRFHKEKEEYMNKYYEDESRINKIKNQNYDLKENYSCIEIQLEIAKIKIKKLEDIVVNKTYPY